MLLLAVHLAAVAYLTGLSWVVQLVVYPSFLLVGPTEAWTRFHDAHSRGLVRSVGLPWAVQGVTLAVLLATRPDGVRLWTVLLACATGLATVLLTVGSAVPKHQQLSAYDAATARALIAVHRWRTAAWSAGLVLAVVLVLQAAP